MDSVLFLVDDLDAVFDLTALEINKIWLLILNLNLKVQENQAPEQENEKQSYFLFGDVGEWEVQSIQYGKVLIGKLD